MTSVSLHPPLVLVSVAHASNCYPSFREAAEFSVSILHEGHREVAERFAAHGVDRFAVRGFADWPGTGVPVLEDAVAALRCHTYQRVRSGDHDLLVGLVSDTRLGAGEEPLIWYRRTFYQPAGSRELMPGLGRSS